MQRFDFAERVTVRHTDRTQGLGIAGWHGEIVGASYEDDAPDAILGYAVAMDEGDGRVWSVGPAEIESEK